MRTASRVLCPGKLIDCRLLNSHQNCCVWHSGSSSHGCSLRDLGLSLSSSWSLCLAGGCLDLWGSTLLLLGQLLCLLLLRKSLQRNTFMEGIFQKKDYIKVACTKKNDNVCTLAAFNLLTKQLPSSPWRSVQHAEKLPELVAGACHS